LKRTPRSRIARSPSRAAEESIVLLKNSGVLPLRNQPASIAVIGPTADLLTAIEGNYNGAALHPVSPLDGIGKQFSGATIHYTQGSTLAAEVSVSVPRTVFGSGLKAEFFATPDWTGRPVAVSTEATIQHDWRDSELIRMIRRGHGLTCKKGLRNEIRFVNRMFQVAA